MYKFK